MRTLRAAAPIIFASGAFLAHGSGPHAAKYGYDEMRAPSRTASHEGAPRGAHAHSADRIRIAVRAGVASIEHRGR